jgi:hypothetical protein
MRPANVQQRKGEASFALVSVLALVSLAALTTTAFLASARLERMSSRTIGDQTRLEMALDTGLDFACYTIDLSGKTWNIPHWLAGESNGIGYLMMGTPSNTAGSTIVTNYALFSPATISAISNSMVPKDSIYFESTSQADYVFQRTSSTGLVKLTNNLTNTNIGVRIPMLGARTSPPVGWITNYNLIRGSNTPAFRFAYFTEDKEGLIDIDSMGGETNRSTGTNPAEISLISVGVPTNKYGQFTNLRSAFVSPGMIKEIFTSNLSIAATNAQYFSTGNRNVNGPKADEGDERGFYRIPEGLGYPNSGLKAVNLNSNLTAAGLTTLANHINTSLPNFTNRAGGFPAQDYALTLAANIIDYADTDSDPTTTGAPSGGPAIRGYDSYPLPTTYYDRFAYTVKSNNLFTIRVTPYVQVWNPSSARTGDITLTLTDDIKETFKGFTGDLTFTNQPYQNQMSVNLGANEVKVLEFPAVDYNFDYGATSPDELIVFEGKGSLKISSMSLSIGGVVIATTRSNMERKQRNINYPATGNNFDMAGALPSLRYDSLDPYPLGDPRMILYQVGQATSASDYDIRGCWWGMAEARDITNSSGKCLADPRNWPDGGHSSGTNVPTTSLGQTPLNVVNISLTKSDEAPGKISNAGPWATNSTNGAFSNICVLGRIFDPIQWVWAEQGSAAASNGLARISIPANAEANPMYGGGNTLRIGKFEHPKFAFTNVGGELAPNMQQSAAALLDIFCVQDKFIEGEKININTAPPAVLRALAAGVVVGTSNSPTAPTITRTNSTLFVEAFVRGVTNFRARHPFYSPSQLAFIGYDTAWPGNWPTNAVFGNTNGVIGTLQGITQANDEVMEECFSKIYNLSKVGTQNYRVYVVAQILTPAGLPKGPVMRRFYEVHNRRNDEEEYTNNNCTIVITRRAEY